MATFFLALVCPVIYIVGLFIHILGGITADCINLDQDFEAVVKLASVTELLIGEGQQTPVSIAFFTYSCA